MKRQYKNLYKRGRVWYIDLTFQGKRYRRRTSRDARLAQLELARLERELERRSLDLAVERISVQNFVDKYFEYSKANKTPTTIYNERLHLKQFLKFSDPASPLSNLKPEHFERYKAERLRKVSPVTLNRELTTFRSMLNRAKEWGYLFKNPMDAIKRIPMPEKNPPRFLSKEEIKKLLQVSSGKLRDIIITFLNTGLRRSELCHLEWGNIDLTRGIITVQSKTGFRTKSHKPRYIPINSELRKVLERKTKEGNSGYIFTTKDGKLIKNNLLRDIQKVYKKVGIENADIHDLRHTFASHLVMAGVDLATVRELLGHSDIKTTMIYAHLAPEHLKGATEKLRF